MSNSTALICGRGTSPVGLDAVVSRIDARCDVIDYREPDGARRWWVEAPNLGEPFDGQLRRRICDAAKAQGIAGFGDESESETPLPAPRPRRARGGIHRHRPRHTDERVYMGESVDAPYAKVQAAQGGVTIRDTCNCGATRLSIRNGSHVARGRWIAP